MDGEPRLMATLLYGCGLRLLECCRLRVKDVDFGRNQITIRRGKGDKDRATMLPVSIKSELAVHLERVRTQHERDLANGAGWVELPVLSRPALDVDARGGEDPGFGDNTLLGRLEMIGDRLVLEVNSAGRLARARQWLEGLPGVSFERATARDVLSESRPVDDKLPARPVKVEPEMLRAIEQMHRDLLRGWVDQPIPALGGLSPRQACKTPEGRRRVERLVRTMPAATYPGGTLPPPRDELLRELGLKR